MFKPEMLVESMGFGEAPSLLLEVYKKFKFQMFLFEYSLWEFSEVVVPQLTIEYG